MQFKHLNSIPIELNQDWFDQAYATVLEKMDRLDDHSPPADWLDLVSHWNEIKLVLTGERARVDWAQSLDVNDDTAADRFKAFNREIQPLATKHDATLRQAVLGSTVAVESVKERFGPYLVDRWHCADIARNPINIELDVADQELSTRYHTLRGKAQIGLGDKTHTLTELEKLMEHSDEEIRKGAFDAINGWYRRNREELDSIYLQLITLRNQAGRNLGFSEYVPLGYKRMLRTDYGPEKVARFRSHVYKHVTPLARRLRAEEAKPFGGTQVFPWNRDYLPQYSLPDDLVPVGKQLKRAKQLFLQLHPSLASHFQNMMERGLIDLENRPGKRGGAFCTDMPDQDEIRILCNSTGAPSDISTLLHESGHAFQGWESMWIEAEELRQPTAEAAEIHSMGMEYLAFPHLDVFFNPEHVRRFKLGHLVNAIHFLCYACVVDGFQHQAYALEDTSAGDLADAWCTLWDQFMVGEDWSAHRVDLDSFWHYKLHIFVHPFYYIDYALALVCALQLWQLAEQNPAEALERYLHLCRLGGTHSFLELVSLSGLDDPFEEATLFNVVGSVSAALS